jgi:anti-sigma-K factor RskA
MTNEDLHELAAGYALDALDADDRQAFEEHLAGCDRCRRELAGLSGAVGTLAYGAEAVAPPDALRDRILAAARTEQPTVVALRPRRTRLYAGAALAAVACAAVAVGLWAALSGDSNASKLALTVGPSRTAQLAVSGLDPAPAGKIYEVWVIAAGRPLPAGLFAGARETVTLRLNRPVPKGAVVAITLERTPGTTTPTPPILLKTTAA